uniref:carbohydrate sulfotransferase 1-like n=1 Tax=Styela clava TaxID=7725 RepID=UPI001939A031|nr:carbohydrate sulfotransferase 1-like [Styela clava]
MTTPAWTGHDSMQKPSQFSYSVKSELKMWKDWKPAVARRDFLETPTEKLTELQYQNMDPVPKIKLPFVTMNKKRVKKKSSKKKIAKTTTNIPTTTLTSRTMKTTKNAQSILRHLPQIHVNISKDDVGNLTQFESALDDVLYPFVSDTSNSTHTKFELLPEQTKGVIIVTNYRSGSTFLGQLFNQHPQAFYTFEPLFPFGWNCTSEVQRRVSVLHNMLKCNFPDLKTLYNEIGVDIKNLKVLTDPNVHAKCIENNFCFRYNHKDLCSKDICPKGNVASCSQCGPVDLGLVNNKCRSRKISAIKVIKLCHIKSLEPIIRDPSIDFKIIHLVRDPRGIASSRLKIHNDWEIVGNIASVCDQHATNVRAGRNVHWLQDRYKLVRYEDMATNPIGMAKEIYDFIGLPFVDSVRSWINRNTQLRKKQDSVRAKRHFNTKEYDAAKDPYSTQRDSNTAMQAWRKHLTFHTINRIQKRCFEALRSLGYKDFKNEEDLLNLNISAIINT